MIRTYRRTAICNRFPRRGLRQTSTKRGRTPDLRFEKLEPRVVLAADGPIITEMMAVNNATSTDDQDQLDQFGGSSDWIEIFNPTDAPISLENWHLSDDAQDKAKWTFPEVTLDSGEFLVVHASGRDIREPDQALHTNFRLSSDGEYLGLIRPDMSVAHDFGESYPEQFSNVSYGIGAQSELVLPEDMSITYHVPTVSDGALALSSDWTSRDFDDSPWSRSNNASITTGIGYALADSAAVLEGEFATDVESDTFLKNGSLWIRQEFQVDDPGAFDGLLLNIQYDDGFVAYLNGEKVAQMNAPDQLTWNAEADVPRRPRRTIENALSAEQFDLGAFTHAVVPGTNVLAIHALNDTAFDQELLTRATMTRITISTEIGDSSIGYLAEPTPGSANRQLRGGAVTFSDPSRLFTDPIEVTLTSSIPGQTIRYSTDGSMPTVSSAEYTGAIPITESTQVWAVSFAADGTPGPAASGGYTHLAEDAAAFSSDLPIVVLDGLGNRRPSGSQYVGAQLTVIKPDATTGRTVLTGLPDLTTRAGLKVRGSSTSGNPKLNLAVELWDDTDSDVNHRMLGMPADSDWVFFAPYTFDRTAGARNAFYYEISNQMGQYAPRTRFVEVFHNLDGGDLERNDLTGIYVIIEKIKRGPDRVNIERLGPDVTEEPEITGGYIWKIDRADPGDGGVSAGGQTIRFVDPKEEEVEATREQRDWTADYFNDLAAALRDRDTTWEEINQRIDVLSWIDHSIINNIGWNPDALRLSGYFHKDREGPLVMGPVWDCDRCMGSEDGRDSNPETWVSDQFTFTWWSDLHRNQPDFWQTWIDRWTALRKDALSSGNVRSMIDHYASQLAEAQVRNYQRWPAVRPNGGRFDPNSAPTWESEVIHLKNWLQARLEWIDSRFVSGPTATPAGGGFDPAKEIVMSAESGTIYYTLDGSDPRMLGGEISSQAIVYSGPLTLDAPATITARVMDDTVEINSSTPNPRRGKDGSPWSAPISFTFAEEAVANPANLRITEVNYNPPDATPHELQTLGVEQINNDEFEFVEVTNISDEPINLGGAQLVLVDAYDRQEGVEFTFAPQMVAPGQRVVVVENVPAFRARFGNDITIAQGTGGRPDATDGQYRGNLANGGESIKLVDTVGQLIQRFAYDDSGDWPSRADGGGSSLELIDVGGDVTDPANWRASLEFGGSPGASGDEFSDRIIVSEVLINTDQPQGDMVEVHNTTGQDIDITGWYLSDTEGEPLKFKIEPETVVPAHGYVVFSEQQMGFGFDGARGGSLFVLETAPDGRPLRFAHVAHFGNSEANVSLGRWPDNSGDFWPMTETTLGAANSSFRTGDVIITEVHYSPLDPDGAGRQKADSFEFIELFNQTADPIDLGDWRLTGESGASPNVVFEAGTVIQPGAAALVVPFDPNTGADATVFRFFYNVDNSVPMLSDFRERRRGLEDEGATLLLEKPGRPPADEPNFTPYIWVDEVTYSNAAPWPADVVGTGKSLTRISASEPGFRSINWTAAPASPGSVDFRVRIAGDSNEDGQFDQADIALVLQGGKYLTGEPSTFAQGDWNGDGVFDQQDIVAALQSGNYLAGGVAAKAEPDTLGTKPPRRTSELDQVFADLDGLIP